MVLLPSLRLVAVVLKTPPVTDIVLVTPLTVRVAVVTDKSSMVPDTVTEAVPNNKPFLGLVRVILGAVLSRVIVTIPELPTLGGVAPSLAVTLMVFTPGESVTFLLKRLAVTGITIGTPLRYRVAWVIAGSTVPVTVSEAFPVV